MTRWLLATVLLSPGLLMATEPNTATEAAPMTGFIKKTFVNADGSESPYIVFVSHGYAPDKEGSKPLPVLLFLHGSGETKGGSKDPVEVGLGPAILAREETFPFLAIIPQSEKRTWQADSADAKRALAILDKEMKAYKTDPKRVYLTGLSMGGYGTWSLAAAHPDKWAAIAPVCGGGNPDDAAKLKAMPIWCFHGDADRAVPVGKSRAMIEAIKAAGGEPKYTEYPGVPHNSWDKAYGTDALYSWLLEQSK